MTGLEGLTGPRVTLRRPRRADAQALFSRVCSDPDVTRYVSWAPHADIKETRRVINEALKAGTDRTWLVDLPGTGVVGICGWRQPERHAVELGYCLSRRWWGQGIASEAVSLLVDAVQSDTGVYRLWAVCHVDNAASAGVLRRCGLSLEGRLVRYAMLPNFSTEPQDVLLYAKAVR